MATEEIGTTSPVPEVQESAVGQAKGCPVEGCAKPRYGRLCVAHYRRLRLYGNVMADVPLGKVPYRLHRPVCRVNGCSTSVRRVGDTCGPHSRSPRPVAPTKEEQFWARVERTPGCWLWLGARSQHGYGVATGYEHRLTHRIAWEFKVGTIPQGKLVLHKCDNPPCVNPDHLYTGTYKDNMRDAIQRGRFKFPQARRGEHHPQSKLATNEVLLIRQRYAEGGTSHERLAKEFGVTKTTIGMILRREVWSHM